MRTQITGHKLPPRNEGQQLEASNIDVPLDKPLARSPLTRCYDREWLLRARMLRDSLSVHRAQRTPLWVLTLRSIIRTRKEKFPVCQPV
jgi:hypothetical protein